MADTETEEWAKKSKRIEAERMKAIRDLDENKADRANLGFLDANPTKVKGWSNDPNVILASAESASAVHIETAFIVVADCSCTCQKHCIANSIGVGFRHINRNLAKQMLFRINDGATFQSKFFAHLHAHAVLRLIEVGVSAIN